MILVLLSPARIKPPHLNRRPCIRRDVHVAPRRRNSQGVDALELRRIIYRAATRRLVSKSLRLRAFTYDPLLRHISHVHVVQDGNFLHRFERRATALRSTMSANLSTNTSRCPSNSSRLKSQIGSRLSPSTAPTNSTPGMTRRS